MKTQNTKPRIAIVGAGPAGLITAILLKKKGLDATIYERSDSIAKLPQAHVVNTRTCEILRELGLFETMEAAASREDRMLCVTWSSSFAGTRFGRLLIEGNAEQKAYRRSASPVRTLNMGQNVFCGILLEHLLALGGDVRFGHDVLDAGMENGKGVLSISDAGGQTRREVFDYVLACDGASSKVRKALDIEMIGPPSIARFATCYFKGDLNRYLGGHTGPVHFVANDDVPGFLISFDLDQSWALMCAMPPDATREDFTGEVMLELARRAVGDPQAALELVSVGSWNMSAQVASAFRKGPFFLIGDAAHRFPPTGGLGLNTGVQDAHNLAWKLAMVASGRAAPELLDTYEVERAPVAARNRTHSVENFQKLMEVQQVAGAAFIAPADHRVVQRPVAPERDYGVSGTGADAAAKRARIQASIDRQRPHWDALNIELGFSYAEDDSECAIPDYDYVPVIRRGARLGHAWIGAGGTRRSTLDFYSRDTFSLLLFGGVAAGQVNLDALKGAGIDVVQVDVPEALADANGFRWGDAALVRPDGHVLWCGQVAGVAQGDEIFAAVNELAAGRVFREASRARKTDEMENSMKSEGMVSKDEGGVRPKKLAHVVLRSDERFEAMCEWYRDMLSAQVAHKDAMTCFMTFDSEHHRLAVVRVPGMVDRPSGTVGLEHVAFTFGTLADLLETYARLKPKGVVPILTINHGPTVSLYYEDPDRNRVELQVDNQETIEEFLAFVKSGAMDANPIGQRFDADEMLAKLRAGVPAADLQAYPVPPSPVDPSVMEILYRN
ncbi:FAD-dependent monooxygenase [Pandoraea pulmonicola]|nr:FAD-dependent monooxygenase [Pandoraea pulmonicola]SUA92782.1 2,4-dichlorophenol 6-monooxygenase [Pandoraea pulmonicola]